MRWTTWRLFSELSRDNMGTFLLFQNVRNRFVHSCHPFLWNSGSELEVRYHFDSDLSFDFYINKATRLALHYLNYKRIYIYIYKVRKLHPSIFPCLSGARPPSPQPAPQAYPGQHYSVPRLAGRCNLSRVSWVCPVLPLGHAWNTPEVPRRHLRQMPKPPQQSVRAGKVWFTKAVLANGTGTALILDHFNSWLHTEHSK